MTMETRISAGITIGLLMYVMVGTASAKLINVDFIGLTTIYTGLGAAPDLATATKWNGMGYVGGNNLFYSDGTKASGISVSTTANRTYKDSGVNPLIGSRIYSAGSILNTYTNFSVTLKGLSDSSTYDLYLYGSNPLFPSKFTVGTVSDYAIGNNTSQFSLHNNYAFLGQIRPTNGIIKIDVDKYNESKAAVIAGLQFCETPQSIVPAPSTALLLGPCLVGLALWRRKHS